MTPTFPRTVLFIAIRLCLITGMDKSGFQSDWPQQVETAIAMRRYLHRMPELPWNEHQTAAYIRETLTYLDIPWRVCAETGTVATLGSGSSKHIALRADIDALPIKEETGVEWKSEHDGCMHACGHDGHTATLMLVASVLKRQETNMPGRVSLLFQPAEEGGHGAKYMIEDGALDGVDEIYGWHNWPALEHGTGFCPDGPIFSANASFSIHIKGQGGHASQPEACRDPLLAGSAVVMALQQIVSRRGAPQDPMVVSVTSFDGASNPTVIRDHVTIEGSIRAADTNVCHQIGKWIQEIAEPVAAAYGTTATFTYKPRYAATCNHPEAAANVRQAIEQSLGEQSASPIPLPLMASEDFSYYLQKVPGAFFVLGNRSNEKYANACHTASYQFNDDLIPQAANIMLQLTGISPR